jgi:methylmalonyl-CoA/ethylmalonyl-CoA epimerase
MTASVPATFNSEIQGLMQIALTVSDVERSTKFYRDNVGLRFLFSAGPSLAFFDIGGVRLMISKPEGRFKAGVSSVLYFRVGDIIDAHRNMVSRGVKFDDEPHFLAKMPDHDLWLASFRDPDGNTLALMCERRP